MVKKIINTANAPKAIGPYSQAILVDGWLYTSGQIPINPVSNEMSQGDIKEQAKRVLDNLKAVLENAGGTFDNVVKTTVYLKDLNDFIAMNEVYTQYFSKLPPARSTIQVAKLPKDSKIEIEVVAKIK